MLVESLPSLIRYAATDAAVSSVHERLLHPEAGDRGVEKTQQTEMVVFGSLLRQLDHWCSAVENFAPAVKHEVVMRCYKGEGDGESRSSLSAVNRPNSYHARPLSTFVRPPNILLFATHVRPIHKWRFAKRGKLVRGLN